MKLNCVKKLSIPWLEDSLEVLRLLVIRKRRWLLVLGFWMGIIHGTSDKAAKQKQRTREEEELLIQKTYVRPNNRVRKTSLEILLNWLRMEFQQHMRRLRRARRIHLLLQFWALQVNLIAMNEFLSGEFQRRTEASSIRCRQRLWIGMRSFCFRSERFSNELNYRSLSNKFTQFSIDGEFFFTLNWIINQ